MHEREVVNLKNTLEFLIQSNNLTKSKLAEDLGVTRQTIINVAKGKTPSLEVALMIAKYFSKDVKDIFFEPNVKQVAQRKNKKLA